MARGISLRNGCKGDDLRFLARSSRDAKQARRLLALSLIYDGASRSEAVRHANASPQTVRDWVFLRFNAEGPDGLVDRKSPGTLDQSTLSRTLRNMGYRKLTARPRHHAQDPEAMSAFKKTSQPEWRKSGPASHQGRP